MKSVIPATSNILYLPYANNSAARFSLYVKKNTFQIFGFTLLKSVFPEMLLNFYGCCICYFDLTTAKILQIYIVVCKLFVPLQSSKAGMA
ncbi:MAG: hypothetical protein LBQ28_03200 [Prevotellaceae bacterium]|nr:hypothetical protein [Prevotellaceae bacterium]